MGFATLHEICTVFFDVEMAKFVSYRKTSSWMVNAVNNAVIIFGVIKEQEGVVATMVFKLTIADVSKVVAYELQIGCFEGSYQKGVYRRIEHLVYGQDFDC